MKCPYCNKEVNFEKEYTSEQKFRNEKALQFAKRFGKLPPLKNYYWGSLKEVYSILKNPFFHIRFENESDYINSFKRNYYLESQIRQKSMLFLKQKVREDYKLILEVLSILSIESKKQMKVRIDTKSTWLVRNYE